MYVYIHTKDIHKKIGDIPMVLYIYKTIFIYIHTYTHVHTHTKKGIYNKIRRTYS